MATAEGVRNGTQGFSPEKGLDLPAMETILNVSNKRIQPKNRSRWEGIWGHFFHREEKAPAVDLDQYLGLSEKYPENATLQLKVAEIYQQQGSEGKSIAKYLQAAEIFCSTRSFRQAIAVYKHVLLLNPHLVQANEKLGEIYRELGQPEEAISRYKAVAKHYARWGRRDKIPEVTALIRELESKKGAPEEKRPSGGEPLTISGTEPPRVSGTEPPQAPGTERLRIPADQPGTLPLSAAKMNSLIRPRKGCPILRKEAAPPEEKGDFFDLGAELSGTEDVEGNPAAAVSTEKFSGFEEIVKELRNTEIPPDIYPDFNYQMGIACRDMGFSDGAIEHFQIALENGQHPLEAAKCLSKCFREKGWFQEAQKYFEKALQLETDSRKAVPGFKSDLVLVQP